jgi:hypothetical protein
MGTPGEQPTQYCCDTYQAVGDLDKLMDQLTSVCEDDAQVLLANTLADPSCRKEIIAWRGEKAQYLINLLQTVCLHHDSLNSSQVQLFAQC